MTLRNEKAEPASPAKSKPLAKGGSLSMIPDDRRRRTHRFEEREILPTLREALIQRPNWRRFSPHQLSVLIFLYGYSPEPLEEFDIQAALPLALEDREGAA
jgi:hypothetical protein